MVAALKDSLLSEDRTAAFLADAKAVVDAEVADKKGLSGTAVKAGYAAINKVGPNVVPEAIESLTPDFVGKLEPYWQQWSTDGNGTFADALTARGDEVAEALLAVTDEQIEASTKTAIKKIYSGLRDSAKKHVIEALPRVGDLVQKHASA